VTEQIMARLTGRRIIVIGGASGIGRATAAMFAHEGAAVAVLDRSADTASAVARDIGGRAVTVDVADPASVDAAVTQAASLLGGIDGVVNSAGILSSGGIADTTPEEFSRTLAVNLTGIFLVVRAALPHLRQSRGATVVNIGSGVGLMPTGPGTIAYVASKGGVIAMSKSMAAELAPDIRVNVVCPGLVETAMTAPFLRDASGVVRPELAARYTMNRPASPDEIAAAILFLTSAESSFVTGIAMPVDGGRTFH
jgi:NAD(P)-dependent dehydrogenase (short-subunit alcohol dehydrogenase family)